MKVLILSKACYVAAYRRKLEELAALPGVDLTLVVPPYWRFGRRKALLEPGHDQGYRTVVANPVLNGAHHLHFYPTLPRLLRELRPDLLHVDEEPYDLVTLQALRAARAVGARTVFFTWQNLLRTFPPPFRWIESYVLCHVDGAIAGNREAADILKAKGFRGPLTVIPQFGVDPEVFLPASLPSSPLPLSAAGDGAGGRGSPVEEPRHTARPVRLGYLGRLVEEKGIQVLLEATRGLEGDWELELVGDGPLRPEVERIIAGPGLDGRVHLGTGVPSTQVPRYLQGLDILVLPSLTRHHWKEQFGRVLVEAMACEVAVVGSDSGEIPHVIGDAGLICREGRVDDLRSALQRLVADGGLRKGLGRRGRERVLAHFTQKHVAEETYRFYLCMLGDSTRERSIHGQS